MKKTCVALGSLVILLAGCSGMGGRDTTHGHHGKDMKPGHAKMSGMMTKMDANNDGVITRDEFMKAHEAMFDRMKGPDGAISLKDMHHGKGEGMRGQGHMGQGGMQKGDK